MSLDPSAPPPMGQLQIPTPAPPPAALAEPAPPPVISSNNPPPALTATSGTGTDVSVANLPALPPAPAPPAATLTDKNARPVEPSLGDRSTTPAKLQRKKERERLRRSVLKDRIDKLRSLLEPYLPTGHAMERAFILAEAAKMLEMLINKHKEELKVQNPAARVLAAATASANAPMTNSSSSADNAAANSGAIPAVPSVAGTPVEHTQAIAPQTAPTINKENETEESGEEKRSLLEQIESQKQTIAQLQAQLTKIGDINTENKGQEDEDKLPAEKMPPPKRSKRQAQNKKAQEEKNEQTNNENNKKRKRMKGEASAEGSEEKKGDSGAQDAKGKKQDKVESEQDKSRKPRKAAKKGTGSKTHSNDPLQSLLDATSRVEKPRKKRRK